MAKEHSNVWRRLRGGVKPLDRPRHFALAIVVGTIIGIIPKFSMIPWAVMLVGVLLPTNLLALITAAVAFSFVGPMLDPHSHRIGAALLTEETYAPFWTGLFSFKYSVWLQLHNSVVLGSTVIALVAALPVYFISKVLTKVMKPVVTKYVLSNSVADWIRGYPLQTG